MAASSVAAVLEWFLRIAEGDLVKLDSCGLELFRERRRRHGTSAES